MSWLTGKIVPFKDQLSVLAMMALTLGVGYYAYLAHDNENMMKLAQSRQALAEANLDLSKLVIDIQNKAALDMAIDAAKKDAEYETAMAVKPKYHTKFVYQNTGDECADLQGIIDEAIIADNNSSEVNK